VADTKKPAQKMRYSDDELSLMQNTFRDQEDVLRAVRKVFLQMPLDAIDKSVVETLRKQKATLALIRKAFLPELDEKAPIHQLVDLWLTVDIKDKAPEDAWPHLLARQKVITFLEEQIVFLEKGIAPKMRLEALKGIEGKSPVEAYADIVARNTIVGHTEMQVSQFILLAGLNGESTEDVKKRLFQDSSK